MPRRRSSRRWRHRLRPPHRRSPGKRAARGAKSFDRGVDVDRAAIDLEGVNLAFLDLESRRGSTEIGRGFGEGANAHLALTVRQCPVHRLDFYAEAILQAQRHQLPTDVAATSDVMSAPPSPAVALPATAALIAAAMAEHRHPPSQDCRARTPYRWWTRGLNQACR